jgi:hypothetical protein
MTWDELLADIRADLQDTGSAPRWSTKMLFLYAKDAVRDYSTWFPARTDRFEILPVDGKHPLPVDYVEDITIECPVNTYLERRTNRPGVKYPRTEKPLSYFISGGSIYLSSPTNEAVYLTYFATHPVPVSEDDLTFQFTVPLADVELIRLYVKAKVFGQMRGRQSALDRFKVGTGSRDDNPLNPEVDDVMADYWRGIAQRTPGGVIYLYRPGRFR